jgi:uncharacterized membrane protein
VSDRKGGSEELPPDVAATLDRLLKHVHAMERRRARRKALAFLVVVVYGGVVANLAQTHDVLTAKHPNLLLWFWAVMLGLIAFLLVIRLLSDGGGDE